MTGPFNNDPTRQEPHAYSQADPFGGRTRSMPQSDQIPGHDYGVVYGDAPGDITESPAPPPEPEEVAPRLIGGINPTTYGYNIAVVAALAGMVTGVTAFAVMLVYKTITDAEMYAEGPAQSIWFGVVALMLTALAGGLWLWFRSIKGGSASYYSWITGGTTVASVVIFPLLMTDSTWAVRLLTAALILVVCAAMLVAVPAVGGRAAEATRRDAEEQYRRSSQGRGGPSPSSGQQRF